MAYPNLLYSADSLTKKLNTLVVADSYYWGMYNNGFTQAFGTNTFWYYNRQVFPDSYNSPTFVEEKNLAKEIESNDLFIIICTEGNMHNFGWGFLEKMDRHFYGR